MPRIIALVMGWGCPRTSWGPRTAPGHMSNVRTSRHFLLWLDFAWNVSSNTILNLILAGSKYSRVDFKNFRCFFKLLLNRSSCRSALALVFLENSAAAEQQLACCLLVNSTTVCKNERKFRFGPSLDFNRQWRRHSPLLASTARTANSARDGNSRAGTGHQQQRIPGALFRCCASATDLAARGRAHALRGYKYEKRPDTRYGSS